MYVVIRTADVGDVDVLAAFENYADAERFAYMVSQRDGIGCGYWTTYEAVATGTPEEVFKQIFPED